MNCIKCGSPNVYVRLTRSDGPRRIYRRRHCMDCGARFYSLEMPVSDFAQKGDADSGKKHSAGHKRMLHMPDVV